jgi:uncharacterized protein (TIGR02145 family)
MKKILFLFAMLAGVAASAQVTNVEPAGADYTNQTVSFRVWWNAGSRDATHLSKVWVWIDYIKVNANNTTSGNTWTRAAVSAASPAASVSYDGSNRNGFWLQGNSGSYSATITVQLNITETNFNWCAYVSDYPPNMVMDEEIYYFKGTPPFILKEADETIHEITQTFIPKANLNYVPVSITDKTACPGGLKEVIGTCPYTGSDWYADPNHKCQQRAAGAQNWEAWIKDTRDNELYRIVLMPDTKWWLAQNVKYAGKGLLFQNCGKDSCGLFYLKSEIFTNNYTVNQQRLCPKDWILPSTTQWENLLKAINNNYTTAIADLRSLTEKCNPKTNRYGWASRGFSGITTEPNDGDSYWATTGSDAGWLDFDQWNGNYAGCDHAGARWSIGYDWNATNRVPMRCLR